MKPKKIMPLVLMLLCGSVYAQKDYTPMSKEIVENSGVQPGEVVVVSGGQHFIPLMEAIAIESNLKGAFTTVFLNTDNIERGLVNDVPMQYLSATPTFFGEWVKNIDVWIGLSTVENYETIYKGAKEDRMAAWRKANQSLFDGFNNSKCRVYWVNYPTAQDATLAKMDLVAYKTMVADAMEADYSKIASQGETLKKLLMASKSIKVTSSDGTNLSLSVSGRPVVVSDGVISKGDVSNKLLSGRQASLPDGIVSVTAVETSAAGKVAVARDECRFAPVTNIRFDVVGGKMQNLTAADGKACFEELFATNTGSKDMFAGISIGLNPSLKPTDNYRPSTAAGVVYLSFGNNILEGGKNNSTFRWSFPIINGTVEVDGKVVVKDGKIML